MQSELLKKKRSGLFRRLGEYLFCMDGGHKGLGVFAPDMVGAQDTVWYCRDMKTISAK
jgi:hypothetical protein